MSYEIYLASIKKVREFMISDLDKTIACGPNFLLALALCCYTEYWGRPLCGISQGQGKKCFDSFFKKLGICYANLLTQRPNIYYEVRCGLAHSYLIEKSSNIKMEGGNCGLEYDPITNRYTFNIRHYFEDFKVAVNKYISGLESGLEDRTLFEKAMKGKPILI